MRGSVLMALGRGDTEPALVGHGRDGNIRRSSLPVAAIVGTAPEYVNM